MKLPVCRLSTFLALVTLLVVSLGVGVPRYLKRQRGFELLTACGSLHGDGYRPYGVVDTANWFRRLPHSDVIAVLKSFEADAADASVVDVIVPLVFEPVDDCPEPLRWQFSLGTVNAGIFALVDDLPVRLRSNRHYTMGYSSPVDAAATWGRVREGQLSPPDRLVVEPR